MENNYENKLLDSVILIDTNIIMEDTFELFINNYKDLLMDHYKRIVIIPEVYAELIRHSRHSSSAKAERARRGLELIERNKVIFNIEKSKKESKSFADFSILKLLLSLKMSRNQVLITNDNYLAEDAYLLDTINSCDGKRITVLSINETGELIFNKRLAEIIEKASKQPEVIEKTIIKEVPVRENNYLSYICCSVAGAGLYAATEKYLLPYLNKVGKIVVRL